MGTGWLNLCRAIACKAGHAGRCHSISLANSRFKISKNQIEMRIRLMLSLAGCMLTGYCFGQIAGKGVYGVKSFGAKGDGRTADTKSINTAIDSAAKNGGGMVYLAAGNYLCGSIHLKSNISL